VGVLFNCNRARDNTNKEIEVVIDKSSDEEMNDELCVRVVFKDGVMTEKLLYTLIGNEVPIKLRHPRRYVSVKRGHGALALYKKVGVTRLRQFKSEYVKFMKYEHVKRENDYYTIKVERVWRGNSGGTEIRTGKGTRRVGDRRLVFIDERGGTYYNQS
jgi:hypothetical protein